MAWAEWRSALEVDPTIPFTWAFLWNWDIALFSLVGLFCLVVISLGCAMKFMELHSGGAWAAELLGGKRLDPSSPSDVARTLLNVVEEMALASGMADGLGTALHENWELKRAGLEGLALHVVGNSRWTSRCARDRP